MDNSKNGRICTLINSEKQKKYIYCRLVAAMRHLKLQINQRGASADHTFARQSVNRLYNCPLLHLWLGLSNVTIFQSRFIWVTSAYPFTSAPSASPFVLHSPDTGWATGGWWMWVTRPQDFGARKRWKSERNVNFKGFQVLTCRQTQGGDKYF